MVRSDLFSSLRGFDPDYFFSGEDLDLCFRARKAGYAVRYCPASEVIHFGGGSSSKAEALTAVRAALSNQLYFLKTYGVGSALAYRLIAQLIRAPMLFVSGLFELIFRGLAAAPALRRRTWSRGPLRS